MSTAAPPPSWATPQPQQQQQAVVQTMAAPPVPSPTHLNNGSATNELMQPYSTLDEPVMETIMRDVRAVGAKLRVVMLPLDRNAPFQYMGVSQEELGENQKKVISALKDWDLW